MVEARGISGREHQPVHAPAQQRVDRVPLGLPIVLGVMTCLVIITAAGVLGGTGARAGSLGELAGVLEPVAGPAGRVIFALGFFGAAFSAMLANATGGGTLLADGLGWAVSCARRACASGCSRCWPSARW